MIVLLDTSEALDVCAAELGLERNEVKQLLTPLTSFLRQKEHDEFAVDNGEITGILASKGARRVQIDYDDSNQPSSVSFVYPVYNIPVYFRLPCNVDGVLKCLKTQKGVPFSCQNKEQARRVGWRILKNWLEAQIAIVEAGAAQFTEVFLPYAVQTGTGKTMFQMFDEQYAQRALNAAPEETPA